MKRARGPRGKARLNRSRQLDRHEERVDSFTKQALRAEECSGNARKGGPLPPCIDCGCFQRANRRFRTGRWAPLCLTCWLKRGKPTWEEVSRMIKEEKERAEEEHARGLESEDSVSPW
jgi:hypothetical protein